MLNMILITVIENYITFDLKKLQTYIHFGGNCFNDLKQASLFSFDSGMLYFFKLMLRICII